VTEYELAQIAVACGLWTTIDEAMEQCAAQRMNGPDSAYGMVHRVPEALASELTSASDARLGEVAASLVQLRGDAYPPWDRHDTEELLVGIRDLAHKAEYPRVAVFLHHGMP
jgi:hypothetical protein